MTEPIEELLVSKIKEAEDKYPTQVVLRQVKSHTWATHLKVHPPDRDAYFILGCYFTKREDAEKNFYKRVQELEGF